MTLTDRPRRPARISGKWPALALAIAVHVIFIGVLIFSVRWQNRTPEPVMAELYAPPVKSVETPVVPRPPVVPPTPVPPPEPKPAPEPVPTPAPEPRAPTHIAKPVPPVERPDPRAADIALKAKQEEDRRKREQAEAEKRELDKREAEKREA